MYPLKYLKLNRIVLIAFFITLFFNIVIAKSAFYIGYDIKQDLKKDNESYQPINIGGHKLNNFIFGYESNKFGKNKKINYCIEFSPKIKYDISEFRLWSYFIKKSFILNINSDFFIKFGLSDIKIDFNTYNTSLYFDRQLVYGFGIIFKKRIQLSYLQFNLKKKILFGEFLNLTLTRLSLSYFFGK